MLLTNYGSTNGLVTEQNGKPVREQVRWIRERWNVKGGMRERWNDTCQEEGEQEEEQRLV